MKKILIILLFLFITSPALAAITFTNGYWSTTFNCADWTQPDSLTCDGVEMADNSAYANSEGSRINSTGNYSSGGGSKGYRMYVTGNSHNEISTPLKITFPSAQTEFWVRFYYKIPSGQYLSGALTSHKIMYLYGGQDANINWPYYDNLGIENRTIGYDYVYGSGGNRSYSDTTYGNWNHLYGGTPSTTPADGSWHCFEFYFNVGTASNNGIFRVWVDGANVVNDTTINLGGGAGGNFTGFDLPHNHNVFMLSGDNPHDIDDIAVALSTYSGFVTNSTGYATGLNMIGQIGGGPTSSKFSPGIAITGGSLK